MREAKAYMWTLYTQTVVSYSTCPSAYIHGTDFVLVSTEQITFCFRAKLGKSVFYNLLASSPPTERKCPGCWGTCLFNRTLEDSGWSVMAHRTLALEGRAVSPKSHRGPTVCLRIDLQDAPGGPVWCAAGDCWKPETSPRSPCISSEILVCAVVVVVSLTVKRWHTWGSVKA